MVSSLCPGSAGSIPNLQRGQTKPQSALIEPLGRAGQKEFDKDKESLLYGHYRLRQTLPATLHVQLRPHDSTQHVAHSCQRNYAVHVHERTVRPTPSSPSITRARISARARFHSRRSPSAAPPERSSHRVACAHALPQQPMHGQRTCGPRSAAASHPVARHFARNLMTAHERASARLWTL